MLMNRRWPQGLTLPSMSFSCHFCSCLSCWSVQSTALVAFFRNFRAPPCLPLINACVANGGWVLKDLGTGTNNPNPGQWNTLEACPTCNPATSPTHHTRPQIKHPSHWTVSSMEKQTIKERPLLPWVGRGGRGKTRKHTNATPRTLSQAKPQGHAQAHT